MHDLIERVLENQVSLEYAWGVASGAETHIHQQVSSELSREWPGLCGLFDGASQLS